MGKSRSTEKDGKSYFLTVQAPPARIICIGAVHISQALAPMAKLSDFDLTIIDRRNYHLFQPLLYQVATAVFTAARRTEAACCAMPT